MGFADSARGLPDHIPKARRAAALETGLARDAFPEGCPFAETDVLAVDYLPELD